MHQISNIEKLEAIIERVGDGLSDAELAEAVHIAFTSDQKPFQILGTDKTILIYRATMRRLYDRIARGGFAETEFNIWLFENDYWPLAV